MEAGNAHAVLYVLRIRADQRTELLRRMRGSDRPGAGRRVAACRDFPHGRPARPSPRRPGRPPPPAPPTTPPPPQPPPAPPPRQGTPDPPPRQNAPGSRPRERPAGLPAPPDPFGDTFAADRPQTAAMPEFLPEVGLLGDEARLPLRTPHRPRRSASRGVMIFAVLATLASLATGGVGGWWGSSHHAGLRSTSAGDRSRSPSASSPAAPRATGANGAVA